MKKNTKRRLQEEFAYDIAKDTKVELHLEELGEDELSLPSAIVAAVLAFCKDSFGEDAFEIIVRRNQECQEKEKSWIPTKLSRIGQKVRNEGGQKKVGEEAAIELPAIRVEEKRLWIGGLCSTLRFLLRKAIHCNNRRDDEKAESLLGFQGGCLIAPAEVSPWTKFCEVEMPGAVQTVLLTAARRRQLDAMPEPVAKFETHLAQPVRMHNIRKRMQDEGWISEGRDDEDPIVEFAKKKHVFAEGPDLLLSDVILGANYHLLLSRIAMPPEEGEKVMPRTYRWWNKLKEVGLVCVFDSLFHHHHHKNGDKMKLCLLPAVPNESLYHSDPTRSVPSLTRQKDINRILEGFNAAGDVSLLVPNEGTAPNEPEEPFNWENVPLEAQPMAGKLPEKRMAKKYQQLSSFSAEVVQVVRNSGAKSVVDFCSGGGHLGILLAYLLKELGVRVSLVENKEESLRRAHARVKKLGLTNVDFFQCNLNYFLRRFDMGVCLHACGIATDLVLRKCLRLKAAFAACPCCYGSVRAETGDVRIAFPKSSSFRTTGITWKDFAVLLHTADQTHVDGDKLAQGERAMDIVDSDRLAEAKETGYEVKLTKLRPHSCTPKNNLLVGYFK